MKLFIVLGLTAGAAFSQSPSLLFEHVTMIDGTGRPAKADWCVSVVAGKIDKWRDARWQAPAGARRIDGRGKFLIPGLDGRAYSTCGAAAARRKRAAYGGGWRAHGIRALQSYIYMGRDHGCSTAGNNPDYIFKLRDMERSGEIVSTRLLAVGGIVTYPGSHGSGPGGDSGRELAAGDEGAGRGDRAQAGHAQGHLRRAWLGHAAR